MAQRRGEGHGVTLVPAVVEVGGHSPFLPTPTSGCQRTWERWATWSERQAGREQGGTPGASAMAQVRCYTHLFL